MFVRRFFLLIMACGIAIAGSATAAPQRPEAGPAVSYADAADDAYRLTLPDGTSGPSPVPNAALSNRALDLRQVDWAPAARGAKRSAAGYVSSVMVTGDASPDGSYVSYGSFTSGGKECQLYHFLTPGITAFANAFCGTQADGDRAFIGRVSGGKVTATVTSGGGTLLSAVFDNTRLPQELVAAGSTLTNLSAFTCMQGEEGVGCRPHEVQDSATSALSYRVG